MYPSWEDRIAEQIRIGCSVLIEVDGYVSRIRGHRYRTQHTKTTIGIDSIDIESSHLLFPQYRPLRAFRTGLKACSTSRPGSERRTKCCRPTRNLLYVAGN